MSESHVTKRRYAEAVASLAGLGGPDFHMEKARAWLSDANARLALGKMRDALDSLNVARHAMDAAIVLVAHQLKAQGPNFEGVVVWGGEDGRKV